MKETFRLDGDTLPNLPCPHDAVIKKVTFDESYIPFYFQNNICDHDAVANQRPGYDSLIIRYHLFDPEFITYHSIEHITGIGRRFGRHGYYEINNNYLIKPSKYNLEYIDQKVSFNNIILQLWRRGYVIIDAYVDSIEYEWIK